jgi:hypothetical protein
VIALVDLHRASVRILDDDPATPGHFLVPAQQRRGNSGQGGRGVVE